MTDVALEVRELRKVFEIRNGRQRVTIEALKGVSLQVKHGEAVAIVGESGSGKTTLARIAVGLERATSGTVAINGEDGVVGQQPKSRARMIQMVFQDPYSSLDPRQTIGAMLTEVLHFHFRLSKDATQARIVDLLESVGMDASLTDRRPGALSGGQQQRAAIARALAPNPGILVLDEAVSALDVSVQAQFLNLINTIRRERSLAILFVTHDFGVVRQVCDWVHVMREGLIVESGPVDDVLQRPIHAYTRLLRGAVPTAGWDPHVMPEVQP
jgi:ABC-type glutathione transport system ATPase component